jgi:hypothetical protein
VTSIGPFVANSPSELRGSANLTDHYPRLANLALGLTLIAAPQLLNRTWGPLQSEAVYILKDGMVPRAYSKLSAQITYHCLH